jgi:hypothetical protein
MTDDRNTGTGTGRSCHSLFSLTLLFLLFLVSFSDMCVAVWGANPGLTFIQHAVCVLFSVGNNRGPNDTGKIHAQKDLLLNLSEGQKKEKRPKAQKKAQTSQYV